ncbi:MAG: thioredoxin domain-containing protein [Anaerolineae bacterium]|nr:thioredoxin domain-containing protein [Anaerolineae bacterium]
MNKLQNETSPYLLQHKDNPVDWYPWGDEALTLAKAQDKPILLSVGYSACHWCHVMAHESFEHDETAKIMNQWFINIKVDREERPDVDSIYMEAVQAMTGGGGWPMTVFLLPDGRPFYGGTYFPLEKRYGMPSFRDVLRGVYDAYTNRRDEVNTMAGNLTEAMNRVVLGIGGDADALNADLLGQAVKSLARDYDPTYGGFSGAPKFPQPMVWEYLLRYAVHTGDKSALNMVTKTLTEMARGGIYDQIGGGFARYSVDALWLVPHFEKMLYDNAQLSRLYLHAWQVTKDPFFRQIATEIYEYLLREMTTPEGGFYSATDADSEGEEGKYFVWSLDELRQILPDPLYDTAVEVFGVTKSGNFEGHNILTFPNPIDVSAGRLGISSDELTGRIDLIKKTLYVTRLQRIPPGLDDKILTGWNGMALASLAEGARALRDANYAQYAVRCAEFLAQNMMTADYRVYRTHKNGVSKLNGYLEDYANLIDAFLEVYQFTFDEKWFTHAVGLADHVLAHFVADEGGFFDVRDDHEALIVRPRTVQDNAVPSGNNMMAKQLLRLYAYTGDAKYQTAAVGALRLLSNALGQYPHGFGEALNAVDMLVRGVDEIALVGDKQSEATLALLLEINGQYRPNAVLAFSPLAVGDEHPIPLLRGRGLKDNLPTAYVCRDMTCKLPVNTVDELRGMLR